MAAPFTHRYEEIVLVPATECELASFRTFVPKNSYKGFRAIWDTGAAHSVIREELATSSGFAPGGVRSVGNGRTEELRYTYYANLRLPSGITLRGCRFTGIDLSPDLDLLIGMDIITRGDFALTNFGKKTTIHFRYPAQGDKGFGADQSSLDPTSPRQPKREQLKPLFTP